MRKNKHIVSYDRINYLSLIPLLVLLIVVAIFFYVSVRQLLSKEVDDSLRKTTEQVQMQCSICKSQIEYSTDALIEMLSADPLLVKNTKAIDALIRYNPFVPEISITGKNNEYLFSSFDKDQESDLEDPRQSVIEKSVSKLKSLDERSTWLLGREDPYRYYAVYICNIVDSMYVQVWLNGDWIHKYLNQYQRQEGTQTLIFRLDGHMLYSSELDERDGEEVYLMVEALNNLIRKDLERSKEKRLIEGHIVSKLPMKSSSSDYISFVRENEEFKWYTSVYQLDSDKYTTLFQIFRNFGFMVLVFMIVGAFIVMRQERTKRQKRNEILSLIDKNIDLDIAINPESYEAVVKRAIEIMKNRLEQYEIGEKKYDQERDKLWRELMLAQKLQKNIMPAAPQLSKNSDFDISAISDPAYDIGGDMFDYFYIDSDHFFFTVGDVSGKGIPAALFMIFTHTLLRSIGQTSLSPSYIVSKVNERLIEDNISDLFVTLFVGILEISTGKLTYCNAAHCFPVLVQDNGQIEDIRQTHGIPIGLYSKKAYTESAIEMKSGDTIVLYTDGLIEAKDENGMVYSIDVLRYNLMGSWFDSPEVIVQKTQKSLESFRGNQKPTDDMTIMVLRYNRK